MRLIGKELGLGHANLRVGRTQLLLGFANVRTPLQQCGGEASGHVRGSLVFKVGAGTRNRAGVVSEQKAELVLHHPDLSLEIRNAGGSGVEQRLGGGRFQFGRHAAPQTLVE